MSCSRSALFAILFCTLVQVHVALAGAATPAAAAPAAAMKISGRVVGPAGKPVAGARVTAAVQKQASGSSARGRGAATGAEFSGFAEGVTDADGRFEVALGAGDAAAIHVQAAGFVAVDQRDVKPGTPANVTLAPGRAIEGTVFDLATGRPLAGADVVAHASSGFQLWDADAPDRLRVRATSDSNGRFSRNSRSIRAPIPGTRRSSSSVVALMLIGRKSRW